MSKLTLSITLLFLAAVLLYIPTWMDESKNSKAGTDVNAFAPAYEAKNLTSKLYNSQGNLSHLVFAERMEHYELLGFVLFERPQYTLFPDGGEESWRLNAEQGTLYDSQILHLDENVVINSLRDDEFVKSVSSEFVELRLLDDIVSSDEMVTISGQQYEVRGNGFSADLKTKNYELQNHVQTIYSPAKP